MPDARLWSLECTRSCRDGRPRPPKPSAARQLPVVTASLVLALAFQCSLERLVESCFGFFVIGGRDLALLFFYLQLEQFFFQRFEQHR